MGAEKFPVTGFGDVSDPIFLTSSVPGRRRRGNDSELNTEPGRRWNLPAPSLRQAGRGHGVRRYQARDLPQIQKDHRFKPRHPNICGLSESVGGIPGRLFRDKEETRLLRSDFLPRMFLSKCLSARGDSPQTRRVGFLLRALRVSTVVSGFFVQPVTGDWRIIASSKFAMTRGGRTPAPLIRSGSRAASQRRARVFRWPRRGRGGWARLRP